MRNFIFFICVLIVCVKAQYDFSYTLDSPADQIKDHPGKCFAENVGLFDKGAEVKVNGKCKQVVCLDGGKYKVKECPPLAVEPPCYAVYPDKPFPECCTFEIKCLNRN